MTIVPRFYNSRTRSVEPFQPLVPGKVKIYCCGPTVYNYQHIGNLRTYIFEDVLVRFLRALEFDAFHVMNITDVGHLVSDSDEGDDKMLIASRREGKRSMEIAQFYTEKFFKDCAELNIARPNRVCAATDHIAEMIALVQRLEARGFTYQADGNIYFDTEKFPKYPDFARLKLAHQRDAGRGSDSAKKNPSDFVLWFTNSKFENQELQWESPWGRGYPGWHIECSAMAMKYLGEEFDIHCGGVDHISVHHTNEIAQSEAATGLPPANFWMHGEFLVMNNAKMAKSTGGFLRLDDFSQKKIPPLAYRLFCLSSHYRAQLNFTWDSVENTARALQKLRSAINHLSERDKGSGSIIEVFKTSFLTALADDLNTSRAITVIHELLNSSSDSTADKLETLRFFDSLIGLGLEPNHVEEALPAELADLAERRADARRQKNWKLSDELRNEMNQLGYAVVDQGGQQIVKPKV